MSPIPLNQLYAISDAERFPSYEPMETPRPSTLFYADFKVAQAFGMKAVRDTFRNCGDLQKRDWYELVELVVVLNHLYWEAHNSGNERLSKYYAAKYQLTHDIAADRIGGDEEKAAYLFQILD